MLDITTWTIFYAFIMYHGVHYHLKEQVAARKKPVNKEELLNFCHLSLCNVIENFFGATKRRFRIFNLAPEYHYNTQTSPVPAVTALRNFICMYQSEEDIYDTEQGKLDEGLDNNEESVETRVNLTKEDVKNMNEFHDRMTIKIWQGYVQG